MTKLLMWLDSLSVREYNDALWVWIGAEVGLGLGLELN